MTIKPTKSKDEMLADLQRVRAEVQEKYGRDITFDDFKRPDISNVAAYRREFGGVNNALKELDGLTVKVKFGASELDTMLAAIIAFIDKHGRVPTKMELDHCPDLPGTYGDYMRVFSSYLALQNRAKALRPSAQLGISRESLIVDLKLKSAEIARPMNSSDLKDGRMSHLATYAKFFGGLAQACVEAGVSFRYAPRDRWYSTEYLIAKMQAKAFQLGHQPTYKEVQDDPSMPQGSTYYKRFGRWSNVMRETGVDHLPAIIKPKDTSEKKAKAIAELQEFAAKIGRTPTCQDLNINKFTHSSYYYARLFGGHHAALEAAGLEVPKRKHSKRQPPLGP